MLAKNYGFCVDIRNGFCIALLQIWDLMPNSLWGYIFAMPWHIDTKLCVCHYQLTQNTPHWFDNSATCWSKVKSPSIALLVVLNDFSGIWTAIILKCLQLLIAEVGLMLHAMLSCSFCCWCAWPRHCCLQLFLFLLLLPPEMNGSPYNRLRESYKIWHTDRWYCQ